MGRISNRRITSFPSRPTAAKIDPQGSKRGLRRPNSDRQISAIETMISFMKIWLKKMLNFEEIPQENVKRQRDLFLSNVSWTMTQRKIWADGISMGRWTEWIAKSTTKKEQKFYQLTKMNKVQKIFAEFCGNWREIWKVAFEFLNCWKVFIQRKWKITRKMEIPGLRLSF